MQRLTQTRKFGLILWTLVMRFCTCITIDLVAVFYDLNLIVYLIVIFTVKMRLLYS